MSFFSRAAFSREYLFAVYYYLHYTIFFGEDEGNFWSKIRNSPRPDHEHFPEFFDNHRLFLRFLSFNLKTRNVIEMNFFKNKNSNLNENFNKLKRVSNEKKVGNEVRERETSR